MTADRLRRELPLKAGAPADLSLEALLQPLDPAAFFAQYWERVPLHLARGMPDFYPEELTRLPLEDILWRNCDDWGQVRLGGPAIASVGEHYASRPPSLTALRKAFRAGCTIVVNDLQRKDRNVALLCRAIERDLVCRANVNLYATDANQTGLAMHYDDEDVLVLQIAGRKHWRVGIGSSRLPLRSSTYSDDDSRDGDAKDYLLAEGDLLYIPRGVRHTAFAGEVPSRHLTVSLSTMTWADLFVGLLDSAAEGNAALRRSVPADLIRGNGAMGEDVLGALRRCIDEPANWREAVAAARERLLTGAENLSEMEIEDERMTGDISDTRFRVSRDQIYFVEEEPELRLLATAGIFEFPIAMKPMLDSILTGSSFVPRQLPGAGSVETKCTIVRRLLDEGFLVLASP